MLALAARFTSLGKKGPKRYPNLSQELVRAVQGGKRTPDDAQDFIRDLSHEEDQYISWLEHFGPETDKAVSSGVLSSSFVLVLCNSRVFLVCRKAGLVHGAFLQDCVQSSMRG